MSIREVPYRNKATETDVALIELASQSRFFLLNELGPTVFILRAPSNDNDNDDEKTTHTTFKVKIGGSHKCSCFQKKNASSRKYLSKKIKNLCVHVLFVLIKILKVPQTNPLVWQYGLNDREVTQVLQKRFANVNSRQQRLDKARAADSKETSLGVAQRPLEPGDCDCPVCQEEMVPSEVPLTFCEVGCGGSMHASCMQIWAQHRKQLNQNTTCPLCRSDWGSNVLPKLRKVIETFVPHSAAGGSSERGQDARRQTKKKNKKRTAYVRCDVCHVHVAQHEHRYKCVYCWGPGFQVCGKCYKRNNHGGSRMCMGPNPHTHGFIMLSGSFYHARSVAQLAIAETRNYNHWTAPPSAQTQQQQREVLHEVQRMQGREITQGDYAVLLDFERHANGEIAGSLCTHLAGMLEDYYYSGGPRADEASCRLCEVDHQQQGVAWKLLPCGHVAHERCVSDALRADTGAACVDCRQPFFPGLAIVRGGGKERKQRSTQRSSAPAPPVLRMGSSSRGQLMLAVGGLAMGMQNQRATTADSKRPQSYMMAPYKAPSSLSMSSSGRLKTGSTATARRQGRAASASASASTTVHQELAFGLPPSPPLSPVHRRQTRTRTSLTRLRTHTHNPTPSFLMQSQHGSSSSRMQHTHTTTTRSRGGGGGGRLFSGISRRRRGQLDSSATAASASVSSRRASAANRFILPAPSDLLH
jgi:hypothetical protein